MALDQPHVDARLVCRRDDAAGLRSDGRAMLTGYGARRDNRNVSGIKPVR